MPTRDFSDYAEPMVSQLQDDPDRELPSDPAGTMSSPLGSDIEGDLRPIHENEESIDTQGLNDTAADADADAAASAYPMAGVDVLAFYKSFRFKRQAPFPGKWGVFLLDAGVAGLTTHLAYVAPGLHHAELRQLAMDLLLAHERYHFWIDAWALGQEITPLVQPKFKRYEPYLAFKRQVDLTPDDHEESLANHYAFNRLRRRTMSDGSSASSLLRTVLNLSPTPYCDFSYGPNQRVEREGMLAMTVANGMHPVGAFTAAKLMNIDPAVLSASMHMPDRRHPVTGASQCPVYYVRTRNYAQLIQPFQGPDLTEFRRYVTDYLAGQFIEHTDHDYYRIDNREKVKVPNPHDKTVRGYELKGTLHKAGMTHKEFQQERQRTKTWTRNCPRPEPKPPKDEHD